MTTRLPPAPAGLQAFKTGVEQNIDRAIFMQSFTVATLPNPVGNRGMHIIVTDEVGGETPAWSDGTAWRRTTDNVIVS